MFCNLQQTVKCARTLILFIVLFATIGAWSQREARWEHYQPRTLQSVIDAHHAFIEKLDSEKKAMLLTGDSFPSQVDLVYLDESRPLPEKQSVLLDYWRKMLKEQAPPVDAFSTEFLFREGTEEHWVVVQQPLVNDLRKEMKRGQTVDAYVIWIGAIKNGNRWEWLFAMNGFDAR